MLNVDKLKDLVKTKTESFYISPKLAKEILNSSEFSMNKKTLSMPKVKRYAKLMNLGKFKDTGQGLQVSPLGEFLNGKTRLNAATISEKGFTTTIIFGVDPESFAQMDSSSRRTAAQVFEIADIANPTISSAIVRWRYLIDNGLKRGYVVPADTLIEYYDNEELAHSEQIDTFASLIKDLEDKQFVFKGFVKGLIGALLIEFSEEDTEAYEKFLEDLYRGQAAFKGIANKIKEDDSNKRYENAERELRALWKLYL